MKINKVSLYKLHLEPGITALQRDQKKTVLLAKLESDDQITVWTECGALTDNVYAKETQALAYDALSKHLIPFILNRDFSKASLVFDGLQTLIPDHFFAKATLEMGFWAMQSIRNQQPLFKEIEGENTSIASGIAYSSHHPFSDFLTWLNFKKNHYHRIKIKISPQTDPVYFQYLKKHPLSSLSFDANGKFDDHPDLLKRWLQELSFDMIEQPFSSTTHPDYPYFFKHYPICFDEPIFTLEDVKALHQQFPHAIFNLKPCKVGGFSPFKQLLHFCQTKGIKVWIGGLYETGIGRSYLLAANSMKHLSFPGDCAESKEYWALDLHEHVKQGMHFILTQQPGLGIRVPEQRIEQESFHKEVFV